MVAPNPLHPDRYVVIARGYLHSDIDPKKYGVGRVGKDIEALPFYWPDYVVYDQSRRPSDTVQAPLRYLPESWLDAGFFDDHWRLDTQPPHTTVHLDGPQDSEGRFIGAVKVSFVARDAPGGFGLDHVEWRIGHRPFRRYTKPFEIQGPGDVYLTVRAIDRCGQFLYDHREGPNRGYPAAGNVEPEQRILVRFAPRTSGAMRAASLSTTHSADKR